MKGRVGIIYLFFGTWSLSWGMQVDLFVHKDKFGKSLTIDLGERDCTNVPKLWANLTMSVDTHGSCMQFYDQKACKGRIAVIQPFHAVHQMDLSLINFHNAIESMSPCGAKVPTGRYVIQSAVDASILTVQKHENEFARVNTLPPTAFIPKAQQWEVSEKQPNEYDIMPRIHEINSPVTYDEEGMKKGSFVRKVWKVESVGRGRYVIKSEWTQKCLYKTRIRTVEEHDCRAWSPNQEWVLRPLLAPTPATPIASNKPQDKELSDGINFQVPSRVVDKYLSQQKRFRDKEEKRKQKEKEAQNTAYLAPYRIRNKDKKQPPKEDEEESAEDDEEDRGKQLIRFHKKPPGPEVLYHRPSPMFQFPGRRNPGKNLPGKVLTYIDGVYPIYADSKVADPVFPEFLTHHTNQDEEAIRQANPDKYAAPRYQVTRRPSLIPEPTGHPNYIPPKKKYDGRVKTQVEKPLEEEDAEDDAEDDDSQEGDEAVPGGDNDDAPPGGDNDDAASEDNDVEGENDDAGEDDSSSEAEDAAQAKEAMKKAIAELDKKRREEAQAEADDIMKQAATPPKEEESSPEDDDTQREESEETSAEGDVPNDETEGGDTLQKEGEETGKDKEEPDVDTFDDDDPATDVAGFMKLLFKGISNKMKAKDDAESNMDSLLIKKKL